MSLLMSLTWFDVVWHSVVWYGIWYGVVVDVPCMPSNPKLRLVKPSQALVSR